MGLGPLLEDAVLNWFRGVPFPPPISGPLWVSLHQGQPASAGNEMSHDFGGRCLLQMADLTLPQSGPGGIRETRNGVAIMSQPAIRRVTVSGVGIWDQPSGGTLLITGIADPVLTIEVGDPAIFFVNDLQLRATA